jgi:hypothetical protein
MPHAVDREEHFVQVPFVAGSVASVPELIGIGLPELQAPLPSGLVGHDNPTGEQELFHIAIAQTEAKIESDAMSDDLGPEAVVFVCNGSSMVCACPEYRISARCWELRNKLTMPPQGAHTGFLNSL